jgi:hypothetical protein
MRIFIFLLAVTILSGCLSVKRATPVINVYGESDYTYVRVGLMWGTSLENYTANLEEEDFIRGDSGSDKGSKGRNSGSSCGEDGCSD